MSTDIAKERLAHRIQELYASDPQFAVARPDEAVSAAIERPGLRLPQLVQTVMDGYANRPALGQRAVPLVKDSDTRRTAAELPPRFETITDRQRQLSLLPLLGLATAQIAVTGSELPAVRFHSAVQDAKIGPDKDIPHVGAGSHHQICHRPTPARTTVVKGCSGFR
jgi:fatty acid CoA ligase FadD9